LARKLEPDLPLLFVIGAKNEREIENQKDIGVSSIDKETKIFLAKSPSIRGIEPSGRLITVGTIRETADEEWHGRRAKPKKCPRKPRIP